MAISRPTLALSTPGRPDNDLPVAGGGGGGTGPEAWTDLDLTVGVYHAMERNPGTLANYAFTNPAPGELKIEHLNTSVEKWEGMGLQDGPVLIWPIQMVPRTFPNPPGVLGNIWRNEDAVLMLDMRIKSVGRTGGGIPQVLGVGPIMVFYQNDMGEGAVFVANNPKPPWGKATPAGIDNSYFGVRPGFNNLGTTNWDWVSTNNQWIKGTANQPGPLAAVGVADSARISTLSAFQNPSVGGQSGGTVVGSLYDSRVTDGGVYFDAVSNTPIWGNQFRSEDRYIYVGLHVSSWANIPAAAGSFLVIDRLRYLVQPMRNRSI